MTAAASDVIWECDWCGCDVRTSDMHETLEGEFFCPGCVDIHAPQLVPARQLASVRRPIVDVHLPD